MHAARLVIIGCIISSLMQSSLFCRNIILEFKSSYFLPTSKTFRTAYAPSSALYGPELTIQLGKKHHWTKNIYGFMSAEYFQKKGHHLGLGDSTTLRLVPLTIGVQYMAPVAPRTQLYAGLGFESLFLQEHIHRACVTAEMHKWTFGGRAKLGTYIDLSHHIMLNLFFNYRFINAHINSFYGHTKTSNKVDLSSSLFGIGLGCRF